jgi:hypothetical protein
MRRRGEQRWLVHAACALYGVTLWLYPSEFRRRFGDELTVTFRNRVEDVLEKGLGRECLSFVLHIAWDTLRAAIATRAAVNEPAPTSLLGLCEGDVAGGSIELAVLDIHIVFAAGGVVLALGGWYAYFAVLPAYVR